MSEYCVKYDGGAEVKMSMEDANRTDSDVKLTINKINNNSQLYMITEVLLENTDCYIRIGMGSVYNIVNAFNTILDNDCMVFELFTNEKRSNRCVSISVLHNNASILEDDYIVPKRSFKTRDIVKFRKLYNSLGIDMNSNIGVDHYVESFMINTKTNITTYLGGRKVECTCGRRH